ncbi:MAG: alternative ribosome rescue aminoacyl-tRNA hydrolase ArfB [Planctomycetota bacterium]|jgi:ribosome-associated protein
MMVVSPDSRSRVEILRQRLPVSSFSFSYARSPGPGGQNVNKLNTKVTLFLDLGHCEVFTAQERSRIRAKLATRISQDGVLRVVCFRERTQGANRRLAIERCYELLASALAKPKRRRKTRIPARSKRRRLEEKRQRGQIKRNRSTPDA